MNHVFVVQAKNTKSVAGPYKINNENKAIKVNPTIIEATSLLDFNIL